MTTWPKDNTAAKNAFYGDFQAKGWQDKNLIHLSTPFMMYYEKQPMVHGILVHKLIAPALTLAFNEIWSKCNYSTAEVAKIGASDWGGCFNIRRIAGGNNWSNHSWACAIDLWPERNGFNASNPGFTEDSIVVKALKNQGALWGGNYQNRKDNMHMEFVSR
jgi:hypothetical protein